MKIYQEGKYIKLVPKKYKPISDLILSMISVRYKRLSKEERLNIDICLFKYNLKIKDKYAWELIKNVEFYGAEIVNRREGYIEYRILFKNTLSVRCNKDMLNSIPEKLIFEIME